MTPHPQEHRDRFLIGLLTGTVVGAGLMMWFVPRLAFEFRDRMTDSADRLGQRASDRHQQTSNRAADAVDELTRKGQGVRDDVAEAVARGAHEVERYANAVKSDRANAARKHSG